MAEHVARVARTIGQAEVNEYARLSFDDNPLHVDPTYAASGPFGRTILHGTIPCAILLDLVEAEEVEFPLIAEFTFLAPAYSAAELDLTVLGAAEAGYECTAANGDRLLVVGSVRREA